MSCRILVIDDSEDMLELFHALLDGTEYEVIGSDFIDASVIAQMQPDLLILDYLWGIKPVGGQILSALKQHPATTHLPVILCTTAGSTKLERDPALIADDIVVIYKPFDVPELLQTIEDALSKPNGIGSGSRVAY